ncbi:MOSC domain-containing protein [Methyloligella sp. 2.7D]|uniref:MOSC domain-containing protein n=1 Tax=unclassified Methyloligella TaxID=2625955 RepID=UPI00157D3221|nr:MOSC domain-containing protein [Methyloligella sp. GL2]QKP77107.1 MOSC domain-containing protein [Methyloligella sp. GL2]
MSEIGKIESLWRYPVKSMKGETLESAFLAFSGLYGDRIYALKSSLAPAGFPYHTGREQEEMILYRPRFVHSAASAKPVNLDDADAIAPGIKPVFADRTAFSVEVTTPDGDTYAIDDPALIEDLKTRLGEGDEELSLLYSDSAFADCRPISLFSLQTVKQLAEEIEAPVDARQFRANLYADFLSGTGFSENELVGKTLRIGDKATIAILEIDPRCKMITLDPETGEARPKILRHIAQSHNGKAGLYAAVLVEGSVKPGDSIAVLN